MIRRKSVLLIAAVMVALLFSAVLTGCGNNGTEKQTEAADTAETAQTVEETKVAEADQTEDTQADTSAATETGTSADGADFALTGKWEYKDMPGFFYTFNKDGTGTYDVMGEVIEFTYTDNGTSLSILFENADASLESAYTISGNTLTMKDGTGADIKFIRK